MSARNRRENEGGTGSNQVVKGARGASNGDAVRYMERERPDVPLELIPERLQYFRKHGEVPPVIGRNGERADYACPKCKGSLYCDGERTFKCANCGEIVHEIGGVDT